MAPKRSGMDLLFHPKKKTTQAPPQKKAATPAGTPSGSPSPMKPPRAPLAKPRPPKAQDNDDDLRPPPPEGPYQEFKLVSSQLNGWKYDVMKFDSRKPVEIASWQKPVKLNRKEPRREPDDAASATGPKAVGAMLGPDGKPVVGPDGQIVMVDAEGRPIRPGEGGSASGDKGKEKAGQKKRFQKKTRQVFLVPEEVRRLRREERYPWVMEDSAGDETWVGKMEEVAKSETHCMFMPADNCTFKLVPAHRWYKFQKKPKYHVPTLEEAERMMSNIKKNQDPERWLLRKRNGQGPSAETAALFKAEREGSNGPIPSTSLGPGGRRLKTVDNGMNGLFGDDDDEEEGEGRKRRMKRELGAEGDVDEMDFEETFADDEEKMEPDDRDDEEAKELEERLKREYKNANKAREGYVDESDDEDEPTLTQAGKGLRKTLQKLEKDGGYDESDDDENPYASEVEEEEEEPIPVYTGPAIIAPEPKPGRQTPQASSTNGTKTPTSSQPAPQVKPESSDSRPTSPVIAKHGGHSALAKRAMSPKMPKVESNGVGRPTSPLAGGSPNGSRATSPAHGGGSRAGSPTSPTSPTSSAIANGVNGSAKPNDKKRKASDDPNAKPKKRKALPPLPGGAALDDRTVIEWLRQTPNATTRDCIHHFQPYLTDDEKKHRFTTLVKEVAQLKDGVLVLRPAYQTVGAPSPPQASAA
ncbi:uncharacterized protein C8Q71DRAFT_730170 [Rhodofomes roseus]|uniref:Transcription initiation factor IIF subunit alpha n=1 Tax=Rhodofomes roseus TaxID=34475 RepID=A0ABQ8KX02_9APHY|nr:uncharacterized protein C8Q71DRAFT_730170 [Rhodofomes roseus]KAH9843829.1 hypothetical protein C8Q71DRAFT_730170 [Rhodofomes roseus]